MYIYMKHTHNSFKRKIEKLSIPVKRHMKIERSNQRHFGYELYKTKNIIRQSYSVKRAFSPFFFPLTYN